MFAGIIPGRSQQRVKTDLRRDRRAPGECPSPEHDALAAIKNRTRIAAEPSIPGIDML